MRLLSTRDVSLAQVALEGVHVSHAWNPRSNATARCHVRTPKSTNGSPIGPPKVEQNHPHTQRTASASTTTPTVTSFPNQVGTTTSSHPSSPSDTSITSSSSASVRRPETAYSIRTSGLVYVQDPEVYHQQTQLATPIEPSIQASPPTTAPNPSDYSSVAIYNGGFLNEPPVEVYSPSESDSTNADDQLVPVSSHLSPAYGSDVFTPFFTNVFPQMTPPTAVLTEVTLNIEELNVRGDSPEDFPFTRLLVESSPPATTQSPPFAAENIKPDPFQTFEVDRAVGRLRPMSPDPTPAELQHYLHIFFTIFLAQIPIVHAPTFRAEKKSPVLLSAMQACGALFVGTRRATDFISKTLAYARETLVHDFARKSTDWLDQVQLILAVVLLQTIGLFHQDMDQRASSSIYHGMLVMMIRQTGLIPLNASWQPSRIDESNLESVWFDWARHEITKRAILWSYMHDCCHCIYFALPSSYHPQEVTLNLPCENALWQATTAADWYLVLQRSSPYGTTQSSRLTGMSIPKMVAYLSETRTIPSEAPLSAFAHFVLVHITLKQLFQYCVLGKPPKKTIGGSDEMDPQMFKLQFAMHNWLHNWKNSPDSRIEKGSSEPPFIQNLVPFYWLGQVAMLAYQENLPPFEYGSPNNQKVEVRFRLVKRWLRHIRTFLKSHDEAPTLYWDELMQLRLQSWQQEDPEEGDEGLLEFFSELS
ncbi:hypothetical protein D9756_007476 [Leucocoprinus leucothites]|uniref:Xylanolytic transcriptional activator regulatory domain-containing protein n=1 Tax=Leucocoprinus leucothites TaxID=201217 RepID=A0A8H5D2B5_9AGAR|nr:hypothetical protein D9756_007476 [Leucoagaricus leucothites]